MRTLTHFILRTLLAMVLFMASIAQAQTTLRLATTTSTENSGLLKFLLPSFEMDTGITVRVISVGSGQALKLGQNGDVDVVLVHSRPDEDKFVADGHGINRRDVMYNDFILVGPPDDPAKVAGLTSIAVAMQRIARSGAPFVSRGDDSGTEKLELRLWAEVGISPKSGREPWYFSAGTGMGEVLMLSGSKQAYTLSDRATYAAFRQKTGLRIVVEGDAKLFNPYGVIAVNPARHPQVQFEGAMKFIDWLTSAKGQQRIADFKVAGAQMFFPSASGSR